MPMHDWTKVIAGVFHDFHLSWMVAICDALNSEKLPDTYYTLLESVRDEETGGDITRSGMVSETEEQAYALKATRVAVFRSTGDRRTGYIRLVSPGNKQSDSNIVRFHDECAHAIRNGLHLLIIDPFPPTTRDPRGLHYRFWNDYFGQQDSPGVTDELPLSLAAYRSDLVPTAFFNPVGVGQPMPEMPLYLTIDRYINVPLEETYQTAWRSVPKRWKNVIERDESSSTHSH